MCSYNNEGGFMSTVKKLFFIGGLSVGFSFLALSAYAFLPFGSVPVRDILNEIEEKVLLAKQSQIVSHVGEIQRIEEAMHRELIPIREYIADFQDIQKHYKLLQNEAHSFFSYPGKVAQVFEDVASFDLTSADVTKSVHDNVTTLHAQQRDTIQATATSVTTASAVLRDATDALDHVAQGEATTSHDIEKRAAAIALQNGEINLSKGSTAIHAYQNAIMKAALAKKAQTIRDYIEQENSFQLPSREDIDFVRHQQKTP